jgi:XapX domain-containing protein
MKPYLLSLGAGLLIGLIYSMLGVRSPAPPAIALVGLLGILAGEQALPYVKQYFHPSPAVAMNAGPPAKDASNARANESTSTANAFRTGIASAGVASPRQ